MLSLPVTAKYARPVLYSFFSQFVDPFFHNRELEVNPDALSECLNLKVNRKRTGRDRVMTSFDRRALSFGRPQLRPTKRLVN